jgi:hypothetical protein
VDSKFNNVFNHDIWSLIFVTAVLTIKIEYQHL